MTSRSANRETREVKSTRNSRLLCTTGPPDPLTFRIQKTEDRIRDPGGALIDQVVPPKTSKPAPIHKDEQITNLSQFMLQLHELPFLQVRASHWTRVATALSHSKTSPLNGVCC